MEKECIVAAGAPPAVGPYSHAVRTGGFLFISGMGPLAADGSGVVRGPIEEETRLTLENLKTACRVGAGAGTYCKNDDISLGYGQLQQI